MKSSIRLILAFLLSAVASTAMSQDIYQIEDEFERGRIMVRNKQFKQATALWDSIIALNITPDFKAKYLALNGVLQRDSLKNREKAHEYFKRAVALYPEIYNMDSYLIETGVVLANQGLAALADSAGQYAEAITQYEEAIKFISHLLTKGIVARGKTDDDLTVMLYSFQQGRAMEFGRNKQFEDAEAAFEELKFNYGKMEQSSDNELVIQGWLFGCICRMQYITMLRDEKKDIDRAYKETNLLIDKLLAGLSSDNTSIVEILAMQMPMFMFISAEVCLKANDTDKALTLCENALTWNSDKTLTPFIINLKGETLLALNRTDEAKHCWEQVKKLQPDFYNNNNPGLVLRDKFGK